MAANSGLPNLARDLIRRRRCKDSLHSFGLNIDIPTAPTGGLYLDEDVSGPAANFYAKHHAKILAVAERTVLTPFGRAIIMAPPGTAKSTYINIVVPPWVMGRSPGTRIISTSYASKLAYRQSRRARSITTQPEYQALWDEHPTVTKDADDE